MNGESVDACTHSDLVTKIQRGGRDLRYRGGGGGGGEVTKIQRGGETSGTEQGWGGEGHQDTEGRARPQVPRKGGGGSPRYRGEGETSGTEKGGWVGSPRYRGEVETSGTEKGGVGGHQDTEGWARRVSKWSEKEKKRKLASREKKP